MKDLFTLLAIVVTALFLNACATHATPEEVTHNFWNAVVVNDQTAMEKYIAQGSLKDTSLLDNSEKALSGVELGESIISDSKAQVKTTLLGHAASGKETRLPITTFLVLEQDQWKINGQESVNALVAASVNAMMSDVTESLSGLGQALSTSITGGLQEFLNQINKEVPTLKLELEKLTDEDKAKDIGQQLGQLFANGIEDAMRQFTEGLDTLSKELDEATATPSEPATPGAQEI